MAAAPRESVLFGYSPQCWAGAAGSRYRTGQAFAEEYTMMRPDKTIDPDAGRLEVAGFPSPAADYLEMGISLDRSLIDHPEATFFFRAAGAAMEESGIFNGDLLVVDRSITPGPGHVVVAVADGEFVIRRSNDLKRNEYAEVTVWGVVRWAIHRLCPSP